MNDLYKSPLPIRTIDDADPDAAALLEATRQSMGVVPNMYGAMANSPGTLATYLDGYARFRSESGFTPAEQEAVFLAISRFNECDYCMAAHSFVGTHMTKTPPAVIEAIRNDTPIVDERLHALVTMTNVLLHSGGHPSASEVEEFRAAGYTDRHVLELVLAIAVKTISNWTNHLFATDLDAMFAAHRWTPPARPTADQPRVRVESNGGRP